MKRIAIDRTTLHVYEEAYGAWAAVWPSPFVSVAAIFAAGGDPTVSLELQAAQLVFREDSFDAVTRMRRGRFYERASGLYPSQTSTLPHPVFAGYGGAHIWEGTNLIDRNLYTFDQVQQDPMSHTDWRRKLVVLGSPSSIWQPLSTERITTGEWLVTLKARHALGVLPEVDQAKIPDTGRAKAIETIDTLINAAYRESPESIVDRARAAAQWCFATWAAAEFNDNGLLTSELAPLADVVEKRSGRCKPDMTIWTARALARLHSRAKPNEQERRDTRPVMEADAEYALASMGLLLRELGWVA